MKSGYISGAREGKENKEQDKPKGITIKKVEIGLKSIDIIHLIEALEGIKLDFDHLYYYEHTGLIVPSLKKSQGRGVPKLYSTDDFIVLRWLVSLQKNGIHVNRFRDILDFIKESGTSLIITVDGGIRNKEEAAYAESVGLDIVITDHAQHRTFVGDDSHALAESYMPPPATQRQKLYKSGFGNLLDHKPDLIEM